MRHYWYLLLSVAACSPTTSTSGPEKPGASERVQTTVAPRETMDLTRQGMIHAVEFAYPREKVWNALIEVHDDLGIPLLSIDAKAGNAVYLFEGRSRKVAGKMVSSYIDCGMGGAGPRADTYQLSIRIIEQVVSTNDTMTRLSSELRATAKPAGMSADPVECSTTGELEKILVGLVGAKLQ